MIKPRKPSPTEQDFLFEIDPEPAAESLTAYGGVPLLVRAWRSLGVPQSIGRQVRVKERQRGYDEGTMLESLMVLNAVGGECLEDLERLREDEGLAELLGHGIPSPEAGRKFLYQFHSEEKIEEAKQQLELGAKAYIPGENAALAGLGEVNRELVQELGRRCASEKIATVDQDATIIESRKQEAKMTYEGERGYQPMLACWAELNVVLADEFRDGNVGANQAVLGVAQRAFAALPETVQEYYYRGDSACYEHELMEWLQEEERAGGPKGFIGFAISARLSSELRAAVAAVKEEEWQACGRQEGEVIREWAEVGYTPSAAYEEKGKRPLRYVGLRLRKRQGELFGDGSAVKHFAVVTNRWNLEGEKLLEWQREKAGTIEAVHDVVKNELAAGVMPCGRFGANAAWLRIAVLTHNVLTALKRLALPAELLVARPKRLRFLIFQTAGRIVHHARQMVLRLKVAQERLREWLEVIPLLPLPS